jgi:hypothetical protein
MAAPLFRRPRPRRTRIGGPIHEYALGLLSEEFTGLVQSAALRVGVISPRTGAPLHVTCRRLRYTFATRLVREGASQRQVAELLDHSDLQNVQCYFDLKSDIVESLDDAIGNRTPSGSPRRVTEPAREVARWMEAHPGQAWLPGWGRASPAARMSSRDMADLLQVSSPAAARATCERLGASGSLNECRPAALYAPGQGAGRNRAHRR